MNNSTTQRIKRYLEELYDIPFDVSRTGSYNDLHFGIKPHNSHKELFDIEVRFKNRLRMIIEVTPEKYAAFSIKDMSKASMEKKHMFAEYARQLNTRRARTDFYINDTACDVSNPETWPKEWRNYRLRVTRSPICAEDEELDESEIACSWTAIIVGMLLALLNVTQDEPGVLEGGLRRIEVNRYERSPVNRELCLAANGYTCKICGFNFESTYGELGHHYIHVHHIVPVSKMNSAYMIDPTTDLIPVCPNCHSMLHRTDPPVTPEELKSIINNKVD